MTSKMSGRRVVLTPFAANQRWECGSSAVLSTSAKICQLSPAAFRNVSRSPRSTPSCRHLYRCRDISHPLRMCASVASFPHLHFSSSAVFHPQRRLLVASGRIRSTAFTHQLRVSSFILRTTCPHCASPFALSANLNHSPCTASFFASSVIASCMVSLAT